MNFAIGFFCGIITAILGDIIFHFDDLFDRKYDWFKNIDINKFPLSKDIKAPKEQNDTIEMAIFKNELTYYFCPDCKKSIIFDDNNMNFDDWNSKKVTCNSCGHKICWENLLFQP